MNILTGRIILYETTLPVGFFGVMSYVINIHTSMITYYKVGVSVDYFLKWELSSETNFI